jgi:hypothetical protein
MSRALPNILRTPWRPLVDRLRLLRRRPLLLNVRSLLQRIPFKPLDINCLYFLEYLGIPPEHPGSLRGRAEVRRGTLEDLDGLTQCQDKRLAFLNRFKANDECAVAVLDGRIVGYQWFSDRPLYVEERYSCPIEVPRDAVYEYDIFILPEHRLAGLWFKFHCLYLRDLMGRRQRQKVIGMVDYGMRLSMNTHLRFGFTLFRRVVVIRIFGKSICVGRPIRGDRASLPSWISGGETAGFRGVDRSASPSGDRARTDPAIGAAHATNAPRPT